MEIHKRSWIVVSYFYLISAICVITMLFGAINGLMGLYQMIDLETNLDRHQWETYADLNAYRRLDRQQAEVDLQAKAHVSADTLHSEEVLSDQE